MRKLLRQKGEIVVRDTLAQKTALSYPEGKPPAETDQHCDDKSPYEDAENVLTYIGEHLDKAWLLIADDPFLEDGDHGDHNSSPRNGGAFAARNFGAERKSRNSPRLRDGMAHSSG